MKILLMRHGEASHLARCDDERELTDAGRARIVKHVQQCRAELAGIDIFLSSPVRRARQTADLALDTLGLSKSIQEVPWLRHESRPRDAILQLAELECASIMLFSHQPFASAFVETLCGLARGDVMMNTASLVAMESDPVAAGMANLLWQIHA